ncbi:MAG: acyl carrier protein [Oscillospiraceae bacterium]|jgi:medium-chain acyl-[acyl-carrier-protein] hydrolase|nr:acyl carrier protein [Oscillospiraceae bacterium]
MEQDSRFFYKDTEIRFYDCDRRKLARIETVLRIMADMAGVAYAARGYSHAWLWAHHSVFLITRASIRIRRMPAADERITVKTWESGVKGSQYYRHLVFHDQAGEEIVAGQTAWVVVDPETRAIQKPSAFPGKLDPVPGLEPDTLPPARLKLPPDLEEAGSRKIVYSDIDGNNHTYNAVYAGIACDFLPEELMARPIRDFRINFKQEALLGETLTIRVSTAGDQAIVAGFLGEVPSFECEFTFGQEDSGQICPS